MRAIPIPGSVPQVSQRDGGNNGQQSLAQSGKIIIDTHLNICFNEVIMTTQRFRGKAKEKRDSWVRQMAVDMPHLSQKEIADKFGLDQTTVSRILAPSELEALTQKLFNDAGYPGNVYKADPELLKHFENQAIEIMEEK